MSYINDALRRAQNEKDGRYAHYGAILSAPLPGRRRSRKGIFIFAGVVAVCAAAALSFTFWSGISSQFFPSKPDRPAVQSAVDNKMPGQAAQIPAAGAQVSADPAVLYRTALEAQRGGRLDEAESLYRKLLESHPVHSAALNNLGVIYLARGRMQEAVGFFNLALAQEGATADPHYNLACIYARMNDTARAIGYLRTAVSMDPRAREWARTDQDLSALRSNREFKIITE